VIRFDDVSYRYPNAPESALALSGVTLELEPGTMLAVLGANGSGKSTLARLCNGLLLPRHGSVTVEGIDTRDEARGVELRSSVGMVFQHPDDQIVATSVEDDVAFGPENLGLDRADIRVRVDAAIADVGLAGLERREPHLLSGGQKQRLAIAGALAMLPAYLVLDEPTSMIDARGRHEVLSVLDRVRRAGQGVLLVTHDVAEAVRADRVVVLERGAVVFDGSPDQLLERGRHLADWGLDLPPAARLVQVLRSFGVPLPASALDPATIATAL
jgi:energy-coupling factor transporter ATPase